MQLVDRYWVRVARRAWSESSRLGWKKALLAALTAGVDLVTRTQIGSQSGAAALRAATAGLGSYIILATLEYAWHFIRVPAAMDSAHVTTIVAMRGQLDAQLLPATEGIGRRRDRLHDWLRDRFKADARVMWLSDVVPKDYRLRDYVEPLQSLAAQMGGDLELRETTKGPDGAALDIKFKLRRI